MRCANRLNHARRDWSGMPGHVGQNDTDFTLLQEELNAPIFRPLRPNFAICLDGSVPYSADRELLIW